MTFSASRRWLGLLGPLALFPLGLRAQSWQWAAAPGSGPAGATSTITATAAGSNGTTVVAGSFTGTITLGSTTLSSAGGADVFVAQLSSTGTWTQAVRAGGAGDDMATALALNPDGSNEIVVTGRFFGATASFGAVSLPNAGPATTADLFVARLSPTGAWTQATRAGGPGSETTVGLALDGAGTATVAGSFAGGSASFGSTVLPNAGPGGSDIFVASLSATGTWTQAIGAGGAGDDTAVALVVDAAGDALVAGAFGSPFISFGTTTLLNATAAGVPTLFVARLGSATGTWARATGAGSDGLPQAIALALDPNGTMLVAGYYSGPTTHFGAYSLTNSNPSATSPTADVFVARLSPNGTWTQAVGGGGPADDRPTALVVDASGTVSVGGSFQGATTAFGTTTLTNTAAATTDIFVARLSRGGSWLQATPAGGTGNDILLALSTTSSGSPTAVGQVAGSASFGTVAVAAAAPTGFAARLGSAVTATRPAFGEGAIALYPNPARAAATLIWAPAPGPPAPAFLQLLDALGREVWRTELPARRAVLTVPLAGLPTGVYLVRTGATSQRLVVE